MSLDKLLKRWAARQCAGAKVTVKITLAVPQPTDAKPDASPVPRVTNLRDVEAAALKVAPSATEKPVTVKRLAALAGYAYTDYFREAIRQLIDKGHLERVRNGVRKRPIASA